MDFGGCTRYATPASEALPGHIGWTWYRASKWTRSTVQEMKGPGVWVKGVAEGRVKGAQSLGKLDRGGRVKGVAESGQKELGGRVNGAVKEGEKEPQRKRVKMSPESGEMGSRRKGKRSRRWRGKGVEGQKKTATVGLITHSSGIKPNATGAVTSWRAATWRAS